MPLAEKVLQIFGAQQLHAATATLLTEEYRHRPAGRVSNPGPTKTWIFWHGPEFHQTHSCSTSYLLSLFIRT